MTRPLFDLGAAQSFLAICEAGSLTAAARRLGITQAAVSQQLSRLERDLGAVLVDRSVRPPRLTQAGVVVRQRAQHILGDVAELAETVALYDAVTVPALRVGILESLAGILVPRLAPALKREVGSLSIYCSLSQPHMEDLVNRTVDLVVTSDPLDDVDTLETFELVREPFVLAMPAGVFDAEMLSDLTRLAAGGLPMVRYARSRRLGRRIERQLERAGIQPTAELECDSSNPILDLVAEGTGWAITTPFCLLQAQVEPGRIEVHPLPAQITPFSRRINLATRLDELVDLPERVFDMCCTILEQQARPQLDRWGDWLTANVVIGAGRLRPLGRPIPEPSRRQTDAVTPP
jgi:DNA-binding transcriptional LysR family regulator